MEEVKVNELKDFIDSRGYIDWWTYAPRDNVVVVRMIPQKLKTETDSGIILAITEDKETVAPNYGEIVSQGPEVKENLVGRIAFFPPQNMFPLGMIRGEKEGEFYQMTTADRLDALLVKDVRL